MTVIDEGQEDMAIMKLTEAQLVTVEIAFAMARQSIHLAGDEESANGKGMIRDMEEVSQILTNARVSLYNNRR